MATKNIVEKLILNWQEIEIPKENLYVITEDKVTVTTDSTKWVSPYNTSYWYTNIDISDGYGIEWIEWALYTFIVNTEMVVASAYRNVRVRIGNWNYIPVMNTSSILAWSSYFTKANIRYFQYTTKYQSWWALHMITDSNTTYSSMTAAEITAWTGTTARLITPANLKTAIQTWNKVQSVNWKSETVVLDADDINDSGTTNKFVTASEKSTWNWKQNQLTPWEWISIENNVISATSSGGWVDEGTVNNLIEFWFWRFDNWFKASSGLYKVLNALDDSDNLWLTGWETRPEIVSNQSSMSAISHSYSAMTRVASSEYAMEILLDNQTATNEVSLDWNSIMIIAQSELAGWLYLNSSNWQSALNQNDIVKEAFWYWDNLNNFALALWISSFLTWLDSNATAKARINELSPDDLLPAIFAYTWLSGFSTFDSLCADDTAFNTLSNNSNAMKIVNANEEASAIYDNYDIYNISAVATNPAKLAKCVKNSDWISYFTSSEHNAELQAQVVNLYNTVVNNSSYFTQSVRTYQDWVASLNNSTKVANAIVFMAWWYYSSTSSYTNMWHSNGVQAASKNTVRRPTSVSESNVNWVSFTNCTFTETSDWYAAIAVYTAI